MTVVRESAFAARAAVGNFVLPLRPRYRVEAIPDGLKAIDRWCVFQITTQPGGKTRKLPLVAGERGRKLASVNDARTLRPFEVALQDAEVRGFYLAFAFAPELPYFFIDADDVVDEAGFVRPDIERLRDQLDTYTEYSVSGSGLHIIGRGAFPHHSANLPAPEGCKPLERYPLHGGRFCVLTGDVAEGFASIEDRGDALAALFPARESGHANGSTEGAGYAGLGGELTPDEMTMVVSWARPLWSDGRRHPMALHLSGYLGKQGVPREQAAEIIERCAASDADPGAKAHACHDSYDALEAGAVVSGWHGLVDVCGVAPEALRPLDAILTGFWRRNHPIEAPLSARPVRPLPPIRGRRPVVGLAPVEARHAG